MADLRDLIKIVEAWIERQEADGCVHCVFNDKEDWEMPCVKCRRACKDYWRYDGGTARKVRNDG